VGDRSGAAGDRLRDLRRRLGADRVAVLPRGRLQRGPRAGARGGGAAAPRAAAARVGRAARAACSRGSRPRFRRGPLSARDGPPRGPRQGWIFSPAAHIATYLAIRLARVSGRLASPTRWMIEKRFWLLSAAKKPAAPGVASSAACRSSGTVIVELGAYARSQRPSALASAISRWPRGCISPASISARTLVRLICDQRLVLVRGV